MRIIPSVGLCGFAVSPEYVSVWGKAGDRRRRVGGEKNLTQRHEGAKGAKDFLILGALTTSH